MNLVGTYAAVSCKEAVSFFGVLQQLFYIFTASTRRFEILVFDKRQANIKVWLTTQWSARDDACRSLNESWLEIIETLTSIEGESTENGITQCDARGLRKRL